ncbi:hypothetical protein THICB2_500031 [Thiomonas sp. CB2]|nr:hypothetical protein THICB2_500031 [Thiomonas sp. CB2]
MARPLGDPRSGRTGAALCGAVCRPWRPHPAGRCRDAPARRRRLVGSVRSRSHRCRTSRVGDWPVGRRPDPQARLPLPAIPQAWLSPTLSIGGGGPATARCRARLRSRADAARPTPHDGRRIRPHRRGPHTDPAREGRSPGARAGRSGQRAAGTTVARSPSLHCRHAAGDRPRTAAFRAVVQLRARPPGIHPRPGGRPPARRDGGRRAWLDRSDTVSANPLALRTAFATPRRVLAQLAGAQASIIRARAACSRPTSVRQRSSSPHSPAPDLFEGCCHMHKVIRIAQLQNLQGLERFLIHLALGCFGQQIAKRFQSARPLTQCPPFALIYPRYPYNDEVCGVHRITQRFSTRSKGRMSVLLTSR